MIGGTSAEFALKTAKLASAHHLDNLPTSGTTAGNGFRDLDFEQQILTATRKLGIGAQFGGKYFCHDVRVVRLPRHGGSLPIAIAVSCAADRHILGKITRDGVYLEQLGPTRHGFSRMPPTKTRRRRIHRPRRVAGPHSCTTVRASGRHPAVLDRDDGGGT